MRVLGKNMRSVYFKYVTLLAIFCINGPAMAQAPETIDYRVSYFNTSTRHNGLPQKACNDMMHTFDFSVKGDQYFFNQQANPAYSHHQAIAFLTLSKSKFLEWDNLHTRFKYNNKTYNFNTQLASITTTMPFFIKGVEINKYCRSAYYVNLNSPDRLNYTSLLSISPTGK